MAKYYMTEEPFSNNYSLAMAHTLGEATAKAIETVNKEHGEIFEVLKVSYPLSGTEYYEGSVTIIYTKDSLYSGGFDGSKYEYDGYDNSVFK